MSNALTNRSQALDPKSCTWSTPPNPKVPVHHSGGAPGFYKVGGGRHPSAPTSGAELLPIYDQVGRGELRL
ncbi:hypothetical protein [Streptomyces adustus]